MAIKGEGSVFELVRCLDNAAWLAERNKGVGGSDIAALMGLSKYKGAYALWAEKSGFVTPDDISDKPAVHWGNVLEPIVGEEYKKNHPDREVRRVNAICRNIKRPWAQASLDYEVRDPELGWGVLEIKTVGWRSAQDWDEGVPIYYQTQVAHYLSVTGRPFADVAVLKAGQVYAEYRLIRDEKDIEAVDAAVDEFWQMVQSGEAPEIGGLASDARAVFELGEPSGEELETVAECPELDAWVQAKSDAEKADAHLKECANKLKKRIGTASGIEVAGQGRIKWLRTMHSRFDKKAFDKAHPGMTDEFTTMQLRDMGLRYTEVK